MKQHLLNLLSSYKYYLGRDLIPAKLSVNEWIDDLWKAPFVLVSHDTQSDPILNYGNQMALELWEMTWEELIKTPSRLTAEPVNQKTRAQLLEKVTREGYIDDYSGVRVTSSGKRFLIEKAIVWNLIDENKKYYGQAATFSQWRYL